MDLVNPKGTRDFNSNDVKIRQNCLKIIAGNFSLFDGVQIETPVIECMKTVEKLYGEEFGKSVYTLDDCSGDKLILRYDLTVPLIRYIIKNGIDSIKAYRIGNVYRRDDPKPSKGRYREFCQCDYDIISPVVKKESLCSDGEIMIEELEILSLLDSTLEKLIGKEFQIWVNDKKMLETILRFMNIPDELIPNVCSTLDKLDKLTLREIELELIDKGVNSDGICQISKFVKDISELMDNYNLENMIYYLYNLVGDKTEEISKFFESVKDMGISSVRFNPLLARGLDYYTGIIYEATYNNKKIMPSSIAGGGRYDNMIGQMSKSKDKRAIGISIGLERIITILEKTKNETFESIPKVYVASVGKGMSVQRMKLCVELRSQGIFATTSFAGNPKMRSQLNATFSRGIPYMVVIGKNEVGKGTVMFKNISTKEQKEIGRSEIINNIV